MIVIRQKEFSKLGARLSKIDKRAIKAARCNSEGEVFGSDYVLGVGKRVANDIKAGITRRRTLKIIRGK